jgi:lysophospholipase L1-like esterase
MHHKLKAGASRNDRHPFFLPAITKECEPMTSNHLALLGDSIFDNASYVAPSESVIEHLRRTLKSPHACTLLAVDGDVTRQVHAQLQRLPPSTTHLVLSVGGNDALSWLPTLDHPVSSVMEALAHLNHIQTDFTSHYDYLMDRVSERRLPTLVCTIYDAVPGLTPALETALSVFNDVVTRSAMQHRFDILDLRTLLTEAADFSEVSPIEPSGQASQKLARAIADWSVAV